LEGNKIPKNPLGTLIPKKGITSLKKVVPILPGKNPQDPLFLEGILEQN